jgi:hypothetical protein
MAFGAALALVAGCGGGGVNIPEGPMPDGGSFTGVWHSPQYGEMQLVQTGSAVVGEYTKDERHGRIQGTAQGNVLRFEWSEERELEAGHPVTTRGRGYFRSAIGDDGDHYIQGEWGNDNNVTGGGPWNAVRDRRRQPTLASDGTSGGATESNVEAFDTADDSAGSSAGSSDEGGSGGGDDLDLGDL